MSTRARIATICQSGNYQTTIEGNNTDVLKRLDLTFKQKPDLVCLPESFSSASVPRDNVAMVAESIPGPTTDLFARQAQQHRCYILCPVFTQREGKYWNSVVVIDRTGNIQGIYDKLHPVTSSSNYTQFEQGVTPGRNAPVFDLDFGRIGVQICFDAHFLESWAELSHKGARIVFWCSAYNGGFPLQAFAWLHHYYVISSVNSEKARIIDPCGTILAETDYQVNVIWKDINLDYAVCHDDFNYSIPDRIMAAYPDQVELRHHSDESHFLVEPIDPAVTVTQLQREFGFLTIQEYTMYHRNAYTSFQAGNAPLPQLASHGDRSMYQKDS
jgi:predicted amidohydrolase